MPPTQATSYAVLFRPDPVRESWRATVFRGEEPTWKAEGGTPLGALIELYDMDGFSSYLLARPALVNAWRQAMECAQAREVVFEAEQEQALRISLLGSRAHWDAIRIQERGGNDGAN